LLATLAGAAALTTTPGTLAATAAGAAFVVAPGAGARGADGAAAAVGLLGALAAAPGGTLPAAAAGSLAGAVSSLGGSANASAELLTSLSGVVSSMGTSLLAGLSAPGESVSVSSPGVQMTLGLADAGASSPLFSAPLTAPGSAASFAPLPAGALAGAPAGAAVQTTFSTFSGFDPFTGGASATGVVKLAFSSAEDGSEIAVHGLTTPITFSMPALDLPEGTQARCTYWDAAAGAYAADGCATMPNPAPEVRWLSLDWQADIVLATPALVASAWRASGPLMDGCKETVLDCGDEAQRKRVVALNPTDLFATPPVGCGGATSAVLRVFSGASCAMFQPGNEARCAWNTTHQAFVGAGCVAANATQCACTHLTRRVRAPLLSPHLACR
jgi:hypothetical protein